MVLGDPVSQVKAPGIFNAIFQRHGVDAVLVPAKVPPSQLAGFVRHVMAAANIDGLWVTIPHKPALADARRQLRRGGGRVRLGQRGAPQRRR